MGTTNRREQQPQTNQKRALEPTSKPASRAKSQKPSTRLRLGLPNALKTPHKLDLSTIATEKGLPCPLRVWVSYAEVDGYQKGFICGGPICAAVLPGEKAG
jgi:hypothetical protein